MPPKRRSPKFQSTVARPKATGGIHVQKPVASTNTSSNDAGNSSRQSPNLMSSSRQNQRSPFSAAAEGMNLTQGQQQQLGHGVSLSESDWLSINVPPQVIGTVGGSGYEFNSISNHISSNANSSNNISYMKHDKHDNSVGMGAPANNTNNNNPTPRDRDTPTQICGLTLAPTQKLDLQNLVNSQIQEIQLEHKRSLNASSSSAQNSPRLLYSSSPSPGTNNVNNNIMNNNSSTNILNVTTIECLPIPEDMSELTTIAEKTTASDTMRHRSPYHHGVTQQHPHPHHHHYHLSNTTGATDDIGLNNNNNTPSTLKYRNEVGTVLEEMSDNELAAYLDEVMRITHKRGLGNSSGGAASGIAASGQGHGYNTYKSTPSATPPPPSMPAMSHSPQPLQHSHSPLHHTHSIQQHIQSPTQIQQQQQHINSMNIQSYINLSIANTLSNSHTGTAGSADGVGSNNINRRFRSKSTGSDPNISINSSSYPHASNNGSPTLSKKVSKATATTGTVTGLQQQMSSGLVVNTSIRNSTNNLFYKSSSSSSTPSVQQSTKVASAVNTTALNKSNGGKLISSSVTAGAIDTGGSKKKNRDVSQEMWTKMTALISPHTSASSGLSGVSGTTTQSSQSSSTHSQPLQQQQQYMQYMHSHNNDTELDCGEDPELMFNNLTIGNNSNSTSFTGGGGSYGRESPSVSHVGLIAPGSGEALRSATPNPLYSSHYTSSAAAGGVGSGSSNNNVNSPTTYGRSNSSPVVSTASAAVNGRLHPYDKMFDHRLTPNVVTSASGSSGVGVYNMSGGFDGAGISNTVFTNLSPPTLVSDNMSFLHRMSPLNNATAAATGCGVISHTSSSSGGSTPHRRSVPATGSGAISSARSKTQSQPSPTPQSQSTTLHSKPQMRQSPVSSHSPVNHNSNSNSNYVRPHCTKKVPENFFNYLISSDPHSVYSNNNSSVAGGNNNNTYQSENPPSTKSYNNNNNNNHSVNNYNTNNTSSNSSVGSSSTYSNSNSTSALSLLSQGVMTSPHSAFAFKGVVVAGSNTHTTSSSVMSGPGGIGSNLAATVTTAATAAAASVPTVSTRIKTNSSTNSGSGGVKS